MKWKALPLLLLIILGGSVAGLFTIGMGGPFFFTQTESPVSGKPETPKDSPEFVVDRFVRSLDRGRFPEAVALLVDSTGKPLDDKLKDAYLKDWASALGEGGELVDIGRTTVTGKSPLNQETLSKAGAEEAYLLTVAITGESRTKCWKLPVDKVAIAVVRTQAGWRVMESWDSWQGMFFFRCSAAGEQTILPTAGGVKVELVNITLSEIRRIDDFSSHVRRKLQSNEPWE